VLLLPLERSVGCGVLLAFFPLIGLVAILGNAGHPSGWTGLTRVGLWAVVAAIIVALGFVVGWRRRLEIHRGLRTVTDRWSLFGIPIRKRITPLYGVEGVVVKSRMDHQKYQAFQVQSVHLGSLVVLSAMVDEEATVKRVAGPIAEHLEIPVIEQDGR
jgi:hypothetical protein